MTAKSLIEKLEEAKNIASCVEDLSALDICIAIVRRHESKQDTASQDAVGGAAVSEGSSVSESADAYAPRKDASTAAPTISEIIAFDNVLRQHGISDEFIVLYKNAVRVSSAIDPNHDPLWRKS